MRKFNLILIVAVDVSLLAVASRAQDTNVFPEVPQTRLEAFETNTGVVLIKGTAPIGSVSATGGVVSVRCKEDANASTGQKEYGIAISIATSPLQEDRTIIDYDELDSILNAIDHLNKIDRSVTSLTSFDAIYTTKGGLRIVAFSRNRSGTIEFAVRSSHTNSVPVSLSREEIAQFRNLIDQARHKLDLIRAGK